MNDFILCASRAWNPVFGDPDAIGWFMTGAYGVLAAAIIVLLARMRRSSHGTDVMLQRFWLLMLLVYVLLGVNKQLDLQTFITATGRCLAQIEGWYGERRDFQFRFVVAGLAAAVLLMLMLLILFRKVVLQCLLAVAGVGFSAVYVAVRMISFHHLDALLVKRILVLKVVVWLELAGIVLVLVNAVILIFTFRGCSARR